MVFYLTEYKSNQWNGISHPLNAPPPHSISTFSFLQTLQLEDFVQMVTDLGELSVSFKISVFFSLCLYPAHHTALIYLPTNIP